MFPIFQMDLIKNNLKMRCFSRNLGLNWLRKWIYKKTNILRTLFLKTLTRIREYLPHTLYPLPAVVPGAWHQDDAEGLCQAAVQKGPETDHLEKSCSPLPGTVDLLVDRTRVVAGFNHTPSYQARGGGSGDCAAFCRNVLLGFFPQPCW